MGGVSCELIDDAFIGVRSCDLNIYYAYVSLSRNAELNDALAFTMDPSQTTDLFIKTALRLSATYSVMTLGT